jgi:hypothetical protein
VVRAWPTASLAIRADSCTWRLISVTEEDSSSVQRSASVRHHSQTSDIPLFFPGYSCRPRSLTFVVDRLKPC